MSTTTTNYGLVKPELTDAADITAMNENWDKIDEELKEHADHTHTASDVGARPDTWMPTASQVGALSDKGGTLSGNLKLLRGNSPTIEMKVLSDNGYTSMYQHGGTFTTSSGMSSDSDESFMVLTKPSEDDDSSIFRIGRTINNSSKYYKLYGEHNKPTASDVGAALGDGTGGLYIGRPNGLPTTSTMKELYSACKNGITIIPAAWTCASYSPTGQDGMFEIIVFKQAQSGVNGYMHALALNGSSNSNGGSNIWVYNYDDDKWTKPPFLPLDGSVPMSGGLWFEHATTGYRSAVASGTDNLLLQSGDGSAYSALRLFTDGLLRLSVHNGSGTKYYSIFGEHNKPSGLYTGNGSATKREIDIGVSASVVAISTTTTFAIITRSVGVIVNSNGIAKVTNAYLSGNNIVTESTDEALNHNGATYVYRTLY